MTDLEKVKLDGWAIQFIENPSVEVQLAAVRQNGCSIMHIDNPPLEVQLAAVQRNGRAIYYIKNPSIVEVPGDSEVTKSQIILDNRKSIQGGHVKLEDIIQLGK